jgi:hypothetical protein
MKRFIFFLIFILSVSISAFSQTEKDQKLSIRNNAPQQQTYSPPSTSSSNEIFQKQQIRTDYDRPKTVFIQPAPSAWGNVGGWNRWSRWGAPYSFNSYYNWDYYDRWGYRRPAKVFSHSNGKQDTVISKKNKVRLGVNFSTHNEIGGWFTIGKSVYFKGQFHKIITQDQSKFYDNSNVNFYNAFSVWKDQRLDDITKGWSAYFGVGKEFEDFGVNISLGFGREEENFQFYDEYNILSNNGKYSFRNFVDDYITTSVGLTHDYKFLSVSADFDPIRKTFWLGAGFNF